MTYDIGVFTRRRIISPAESYFAVPAVGGGGGGAYVGPGDSPGPTVVSDTTSTGWRGWWGMRGFTAAKATAGIAAIRVRDSTTPFNEADIHLTSSGGLNATELSAALPGGHTGTITTYYDQTGLGNDLTNTTAALQPAFVPSIALAGSKPGARFNGAHALTKTAISGSVSIDTQYSLLGVFMANNTVVSVRNSFIGGQAGNVIIHANQSSVASVYGISGASHLFVAATDGLYHTAISNIVASPALSNLWVDGSPGTALDIGSPFITIGQIVSMGALDTAGTSQPLTGDVCEGGIYMGDVTSYISALDANMSTYYGI